MTKATGKATGKPKPKPKSKPKPKAKSKPKAVFARIEALVDELDLEGLEAFLAEEGAVAALDQWGALELSLRWPDNDWDRRLPFFRRLVAAGADLNRSYDFHETGFQAFVRRAFHDLELGAFRAVVDDLVAKGADVGASSADGRVTSAFDIVPYQRAPNADALIGVLAPHASQAARRECLIAALRTHTEAACAVVDAMLTLVEDVDAVGKSGIGPIHVAAVEHPEFLERILSRARDVNLRATREGEIDERLAKKQSSRSVAAAVRFLPGSTALDLVVQARALLKGALARYSDETHMEPLRQRRIDRLDRAREMLENAGVRPGLVAPATAPAYKARIDAELQRLAAWANADVADLQRKLDTIPTPGRDATATAAPVRATAAPVRATAARVRTTAAPAPAPAAWAYLVEAVAAARSIFTSNLITDVHTFHFLLANDPFYGDREFVEDVKLRHYPEEARAAIKAGMIVAGSGGDLIVLWPRAESDPSPRVCHAHMEGFWMLGDSVEDFVAAEVSKIVQQRKRSRESAAH